MRLTTKTKSTAYRRITALATAIAVVASLILPLPALAATEYNTNIMNKLDLSQAWSFSVNSSGDYVAPTDGWVFLNLIGKYKNLGEGDYIYTNGSISVIMPDGTKQTFVSGSGASAAASAKQITLYVPKGTKMNFGAGTVEGVFFNSSDGTDEDKNLLVNGTSTLNGRTAVNSSLAVSGDSTLNGNTSVGQNLTVTGGLNVCGSSEIAGNATVRQNLTVNGNTTVAGTVTANEVKATTSVTAGNSKLTAHRLSVGGSEYITNNGINANNNAISNVTAQTLASGGTYAATTGQLYATNENVKANTAALANKADKAATLSGYGITDAYTQTETNSVINNAVTNKADKSELKDSALTEGKLNGAQLVLTSTDSYSGAQTQQTIDLSSLETETKVVTDDVTFKGGKNISLQTDEATKTTTFLLTDDLTDLTSVATKADGSGNKTIMSSTGISVANGGTVLAADSLTVAGTQYITNNGISAGNKAITNVAAGELSVGSTEAVNGSQLYATNKAVETNTADIATNKTAIATNTANIVANTGNINVLQSYFNTDGKAYKAVTADTATVATRAAEDSYGNDIASTYATNINVANSYATKTAVLTNTADIAANAADIAVIKNSEAMTSGINAAKVAQIEVNTSDILMGKVAIAENTQAIANKADRSELKNSALTEGKLNGTQLVLTSTDSYSGAQTQQTIDLSSLETETKVVTDDVTFKGGKNISLQTDEATKTTTFLLTDDLTDLTSVATKVDGSGNKTIMSSTGISVANGSTVLAADSLTVAGTQYITAAGINAGNKAITNVAAGELSAGSTEAVNGSQLYATNKAVETNRTEIASNSEAIKTNSANIATISASEAMTSGITSEKVAQIETNKTNITANTGNISRLQSYFNADGKALKAIEATTADSATKAVQDAEGNTISATYAKTADVASIYATKTSLSEHTDNTAVHVTAEERSVWNAKQAALTETQLSAVNSGITADKVTKYDNYETEIAKKANSADVYVKNETYTKTEADSAISTAVSKEATARNTAISTATKNKADKATTLAGYGITDAYTKSGTDTAISTAVANEATARDNAIAYAMSGKADKTELKGSKVTNGTLNAKTLVLTSTDGYSGAETKTEVDLSSLEAETVINAADTTFKGDGKNISIQTTENPEGSETKYTTVLKLTDELTGIKSITTAENTSGNKAVYSAQGITITDSNSETVAALLPSQVTIGTSSLTTDTLTVGGVQYITADGINANGMKIEDVADGTAVTDAATVGQTAGKLEYISNILTLSDRNGNVIDSVTITGGSGNSSSANAVEYDTVSGKRQNSVTLKDSTGKTTSTVALMNLAAGTLAEGSTDAVTGAQLYATNENVTANSTAIAENTENITVNTAAISANTTAIAKNSTAIETNANKIATNIAAIAAINESAVMTSGITAEKIEQYDSYKTQIEKKADASEALKSVQIGNTGVMTQTTVAGTSSTVAQLKGTKELTNATLDAKTLVITTTDAYTGAETKTSVDLTDLEAQTVIENGDTKYKGDDHNVSIETKEETEGSGKYVTTIKLTDELTDITSITTKADTEGKTTTLTSEGVSVADGASSLIGTQLTVGTSSLTTDTLTVGGAQYITTDGINANGKKITGLAVADITATSTDAVTGAQLYEANEAVNSTTEKLATRIAAETKRATAAESVTVNGKNINEGSGIEIKAGENIELLLDDNALIIQATGTGTATDENAVHYDMDSEGSRQNSVTFYDSEGKTKETGGSTVTLKNVTLENSTSGSTTGGSTSTVVDSGKIEVISEKEVSGGGTESSGVTIEDGGIVIDSKKEGTTETSEKETGSSSITIKDGEITVSEKKTDTETGSESSSSVKISDGSISVEDTKTDSETGKSETHTVTIEDGTVKTDRLDGTTENWEGIKYADSSSLVEDIVALDRQVSMISGNQENMTTEELRKTAAKATGTNSTAVGYSSYATGEGSTAVGYGNNVSGVHSTGVGYKNTVTGNYSGAFGDPNTVSGNNSYAVGNNNTISGDNNFVLGNSVTISSGITNSVALGNGSTVTESNVVSVGNATTQRRIVNVADGINATDAATVGQVSTVNQRVTDIQNQAVANSKETREVGAMSAALAGLHYVEPSGEGDDKFTGAVAYGGYRGENAAAVGVAYKPNSNLMVSASTSVGNSQNAYNAGISFKFGKGNSKKSGSAVQQQQIAMLNEKVAKLEDILQKAYTSRPPDLQRGDFRQEIEQEQKLHEIQQLINTGYTEYDTIEDIAMQ